MPSLYQQARRLQMQSHADTIGGIIENTAPTQPVSEAVELPLHPRFEGAWAIGLQGTGKTQLFQSLISRDLDDVAAGHASVIILDPTGDEHEPPTLIHNVVRLRRFAPGGDLHGKLVYIDPTVSNYTLPINLFSLRADLEDEDAISSVISSYVSIIGGLMGQPLTSHQDPVLRYAVQAALVFPQPTFQTLCDIIAVPPSISKGHAPPLYEPVLHKLHPIVQSYFRSTFESEGPRRSRGEIMNRLASMTADPKFRRLFTASETRIDFSKEINQPKVIVINASRASLRSMTQLYGRYFLALIKRAGEERPASSIPCFIYIDECDEFVSEDENAADILLKLRRKRMALTLGNQLVSRIRSSSVQQAFLGTAIKFVNADPDSAAELAKAMNLVLPGGRPDTKALIGRKPLDFAFHIRGRSAKVQSYKVQPGLLEAQPHMTDIEWRTVWDEVRSRYYVPVKPWSAPEEEPPVGNSSPPNDDDADPARPSSTSW